MTATLARRRGRDGAAAVTSADEFRLGRADSDNPWLRGLPAVCSAPKPAELVAAEARLDDLRAEQSALRAGYEAAMAGEDMARLTELRVRGEILPALVEAAERMMLERRRNWLEASRGLLVPHGHRLSDELEARQEQRDRLDVELDQLRHALAELRARRWRSPTSSAGSIGGWRRRSR
ncbi:MAG: hypothetical protein H0U21_05975 [Acidimicrobiia bacterium]|nr:hypothetical protein [Acidimicrobiia bacterium]